MKHKATEKKIRHEHGNALFLILIAVALFAALSYAVTQSGRSGGGVDKETMELKIAEIFDYTSLLEQTIQRLVLINGCQDIDLSFENSVVAGYTNTNTPPDDCKIFHPDGGGLSWKSMVAGINDGSDWLFTVNRVINVGTHDPPNDDFELMVIIPNIDQTICSKLNSKLDNTIVIPQENDSINITKFTGTYVGAWLADPGGDVGPIAENYAYCFEGNVSPAAGTYHFYSVILAR